MKLLLCLLLMSLAAPYGAVAQDKRLLTMEETILSRELNPKTYFSMWSVDQKGKPIYGELKGVGEHYWYYPATGKPATLAKSQPTPKPRYFTEENNLLAEIDGRKVAITNNADKNIVSGSHVSRNEFGIEGGIFPSPDGWSVAFYQKDESNVTTFPLLDITTRTGSLVEIKYPMAGMPSERVRLGVWNAQTEQTVWMNVTDFDEERYLTNITWSPDGELIYIQVLNRAQNEMHLNSYSATTGKLVENLFTESDSRYVEPLYPLRWLDDKGDRFIYSTNVRDGYWNLYLYERNAKSGQWQWRRLTEVDADVKYVAHDTKWVYYYTAEFSSAEQHLAKVNLKNGKRVRLTHEEGWHNCRVSHDGKWFIDNYSSLKVPRVVNIASTDGKTQRTIFTAPDPTEGYNYTEIELGTIPSADGKWENWYRLIYPLDFDPAKKYPAIVYVYGGPHSQMVNNSYLANLRRWEMYMAQRGYVVFVMDNRGTLGQGAEYEKAIHRQCGKCEMEDQMKGVEWLLSHPWVDADRIGVHGWSYGGFMTISLMTHYPDVFKVGVAGGPVIDWKWYEVMYGERYMDTPEENPEGYAATSLIAQAKNLKGKLLICQGAIDPVVVWQHSLSFIRECVVNNIQVDYFPYPRHEHNVLGKDRVHLMDKVTLYFEDYLK
ncbi:MAG: DPP IV N-terminal domain-containing protein [Tidjanibacter sp.]|nr:DPP IV N-terminal domain-containing protein [Tidjanibacter sp.]